MSYSQSDEERYILEHVPVGGAFLDIGAFDGKTFSNSLALVERGSEGVLVEPSIDGFKALLARHGNAPNCHLVHAVVGTKQKLVPFWNSPDAVSTSDEAHMDKWASAGAYEPVCWMWQITVGDLVTYFPFLRDAAFVNIDTEGTSAELFLDWPFHCCWPKVFCVEYDAQRDKLLEFASWHGYAPVYESNENLVIVRG